MSEVGKVTYVISGKNDQFKKDVDQSKSIAQNAAGAIGQAFDQAMSKAAGYVKQAFTAVLTTGIEYNATMERYTTALTTALGDEGKALEAIADIQKDAAKTPFDVAGLTQANMLLISAGESAGDARDVVLALGDAVSATGGGNNELARMSANLQQIRNVGKATAMDVRQFQMAGIDLFGILSDYTGKTTAEVQQMDVTYELLAESLKAAASEGGRYFEAMEAQSHTFSGQLSTLKDNAAAVAGEITEGLFRRLADDVLPKLNEALQSIDTESLANGLSSVAGVLVDVLTLVIDIAPAILAIGAAIAAAQISKKVMGALTSIIPKLAEVTVGAMSLTGVISLAAAAVAAVVAAFVIYTSTLNDIRNRYKNLTDAVYANKKAFEEHRAAIKADGDSALTLAAKITALSQKEHKSAEDKIMLAAMIKELNGLMPELNLLYDEQTDSLNMSTAAVTAYIGEQGRMSEAEERARAYTDAVRQQKEIEDELTTATERHAQIQEQANETFPPFLQFMSSFTGGVYQAFEAGLKADQEAIDKLTAASEENQRQISEFETEISTASNTTSEAAQRMASAVQAYGQRWNETHASVKQAVNSEIGLFEDMTIAVDTNVKEMTGALDSQAKFFSDYATNLNKAMERGVDEGLVKRLANGSAESAKYLAAISTASDKEIEEMNAAFRRSQEGKDAFIDVLTTIQTTTEQDMQNMVSIIGDAVSDMNMNDEAMNAAVATMQGYLQGINRYENQIIEAYARIARAGQKTLAMVNDAHSPSRKFMKQGEYVGEGYVQGILKLIPEIEDAAVDMSIAAMPSLDSIQAAFSASLPSMENINNFITPAAQFMQPDMSPRMAAPVVIDLDGREIARATAWWTSEQMAWEEI